MNCALSTLLGRSSTRERRFLLLDCPRGRPRAQRPPLVRPDESFVLGPIGDPPPEVPDLAIEVVWTSGGIDKLEVYRGLGFAEVWFWQDGVLGIHLLDGEVYRRSERSRLLPDLDPNLIVRFMAYPSQTQAVRGLRQALNAPSS